MISLIYIALITSCLNQTMVRWHNILSRKTDICHPHPSAASSSGSLFPDKITCPNCLWKTTLTQLRKLTHLRQHRENTILQLNQLLKPIPHKAAQRARGEVDRRWALTAQSSSATQKMLLIQIPSLGPALVTGSLLWSCHGAVRELS